MDKSFIIHVDDHTRENQKFGVYGFTVRNSGKIIDTRQGYLGTSISNYKAEYQAILKVLKYVVEELNTKDGKVRVFLDNERVYHKCIGKKDGKLIKDFLNKIDDEVEFNKTTSSGVRNAHLLCSSEYSNLHPFPGYIRDLEPEDLIK